MICPSATARGSPASGAVLMTRERPGSQWRLRVPVPIIAHPAPSIMAPDAMPQRTMLIAIPASQGAGGCGGGGGIPGAAFILGDIPLLGNDPGIIMLKSF